jgi:hypothetical protein
VERDAVDADAVTTRCLRTTTQRVPTRVYIRSVTMRAFTEDTRLNYGEHALILSRRDFAMYNVKVWTYVVNGNTHLNPLFREIDLGIHADYTEAKRVGEDYITRYLT